MLSLEMEKGWQLVTGGYCGGTWKSGQSMDDLSFICFLVGGFVVVVVLVFSLFVCLFF